MTKPQPIATARPEPGGPAPTPAEYPDAMDQDTDALDTADDTLVADDAVDELLIEEISIDGMCGVY